MHARQLRIMALSLTVAVLSLLNVRLAFAHNWGRYHWHGGTVLDVWVTGSRQAEARAALRDWDTRTKLTLRLATSHADISVYGANFGNTGWAGLATLEDIRYDRGHLNTYSRIMHAHATFNTYYRASAASAQGTFCQEIGHTFGLAHSNTGDCMGKSYYNNINVTGPHNRADINGRNWN